MHLELDYTSSDIIAFAKGRPVGKDLSISKSTVTLKANEGKVDQTGQCIAVVRSQVD